MRPIIAGLLVAVLAAGCASSGSVAASTSEAPTTTRNMALVAAMATWSTDHGPDYRKVFDGAAETVIAEWDNSGDNYGRMACRNLGVMISNIPLDDGVLDAHLNGELINAKHEARVIAEECGDPGSTREEAVKLRSATARVIKVLDDIEAAGE